MTPGPDKGPDTRIDSASAALAAEEARRMRIEQAMAVYATDDDTRLRTGGDETEKVTGADGELHLVTPTPTNLPDVSAVKDD